MNNRLKFRVWDSGKKQYEYFELHNMTVPDRLLCQHKYPVQQFTGLTDSKENEVWEGDILVEKHDGGEGEAYIGAVSFMAGTFMIDGDSLYNYIYNHAPDVLEDFTVEGNIFENPELLKQ